MMEPPAGSVDASIIFFSYYLGAKFCSIGITIGRKIQSYFRKMTNLDKKLPKMPIMWNSWPKNAKYSNTVHTTLFFVYATSKKKTNFKRSSLFSNVLPKLQKRKQSVLSLAKIKTKFSKNFWFVMKFGIFWKSNSVFWNRSWSR